MLIKKYIREFLIESKWILTIFYVGLIIALLIYSFVYCEDLFSLCKHFLDIKQEDIMLKILQLVDITMIANLIKMIVVGSYQNFVEPLEDHREEHVSSGGLKIKMMASLIGITVIDLIQVSLNTAQYTTKDIVVKFAVLVGFILTVLVLAVVEYLYVKGKNLKSH